MVTDNFKCEVIPHKFGNSWVSIYRGSVGVGFYLKKEEISKLLDIVKDTLENRKKYRIGQRYQLIFDGVIMNDTYILAKVSKRKACLISINHGHPWSKCVKMDPHTIYATEEQMQKLIGDDCEFKLIKEIA